MLQVVFLNYLARAHRMRRTKAVPFYSDQHLEHILPMISHYN